MRIHWCCGRGEMAHPPGPVPAPAVEAQQCSGSRGVWASCSFKTPRPHCLASQTHYLSLGLECLPLSSFDLLSLSQELEAKKGPCYPRAVSFQLVAWSPQALFLQVCKAVSGDCHPSFLVGPCCSSWLQGTAQLCIGLTKNLEFSLLKD